MHSTKSARWLSVGAAVVAAGFIAGCAPAAPAASSPGVVAGPGTTSAPNTTRGTTTGPNENIRVADAPNPMAPRTTGREIPNPKAGATRGADICTVRFDSRARLNIQTFVDGEYTGAMGHYGDLYTYAIAGPTRLYARAVFTDGSYSDWGPVTVDCPAGGSYTWTITHTQYR